MADNTPDNMLYLFFVSVIIIVTCIIFISYNCSTKINTVVLVYTFTHLGLCYSIACDSNDSLCMYAFVSDYFDTPL